MNAANRQPILIIEPNKQLREEIVNFLLTSGYEEITATDSLSTVIDKIGQSAYEVIVADAGAPLATGLRFATDLAKLSPGSRLILTISADDQLSCDQITTQSAEVRFLIKTGFARNLLYLLEENAHS